MIGFILADLRRMWAGSLVVVILIALSTALGVGVTLQERALRLGSARAAERFDLVVGSAGSETQLVLSSVFLQPSPLPLMPGRILKRLAEDPRVAWAAPIGFGDFFEGYPIVGTSSDLVSDGGRHPPAAGRSFAALGEAVVGALSPLAIGAEIAPMHGLAGEGGRLHAGVRYTVVGRLAPTGTAWDRAILVPIEAVWRVHGLGRNNLPTPQSLNPLLGGPHSDDPFHVDPAAHAPHLGAPWPEDLPGLPAVLVKPKSIADAYRLRGEYRRDPTLGVFPGEVLTRLYATLGDARQVLSWVAAGAEGLVAAAVVLVTVVHVTQRRRQIGALRAFGAPRLAVFGIVWTELFTLTVTGVGLGFAIGYGAARLLSTVLAGRLGVPLPVVFVGADATAAAILLAAAALITALPAVLAYRQPAVSALRG